MSAIKTLIKYAHLGDQPVLSHIFNSKLPPRDRELIEEALNRLIEDLNSSKLK